MRSAPDPGATEPTRACRKACSAAAMQTSSHRSPFLGSERSFSSTSSNVGATPAVLVDQFAGKYLAGPPGGPGRAGVLQAVGAFLPRLIIRRRLCVDLRGVLRIAQGGSHRVIRGYMWCAV